MFSFVAALSAHWALLQTVAWTTMLADNLQSCSLHDAMARTFDGQHPCPLCKAIAAGKNSEQKNQTILVTQRLDFLPVQGCLLLTTRSPVEISLANTFAEFFPQEPPTPPPRAFFV
jgi:hypothetical protein